jgi:CRP-like cAMP-binding protein
MARPKTNGTRGNGLLNAFSVEVRERLDPVEEDHKSHEVLVEADHPPEWLYFPHRGTVVSLTRSTETGTTVEVGIVGFEGVVSVHALLAPGSIGADAVVQIAGSASRVKLEKVRAVLNDDAAAREVLHACSGAFLTQVSQHALCNRLHSIEQRLAKWLLGVHDRIDTDEIGLTHDFLSHMIGIRRSGVTVAVGALALDGLVTHSRASVTIVDREGLESRACECYAVITEATLGLFERA